MDDRALMLGIRDLLIEFGAELVSYRSPSIGNAPSVDFETHDGLRPQLYGIRIEDGLLKLVTRSPAGMRMYSRDAILYPEELERALRELVHKS